MRAFDRCPDCTAVRSADGDLCHDESCPLGRGYDQCQADDRMWFGLHPQARERRRPAHWAEVAEMRLAGIVPLGAELLSGDVVVTPIAEGIRTKRFDDLLWIVPVGTAR